MKFVLHDDVAEVLQDLQTAFDSGQIEGITVLVITPDRELNVLYGNMGQLERLGALKMLEQQSINTIFSEE